jgi:glycine/D-amino acid oxidase-like deaminating enzyme
MNSANVRWPDSLWAAATPPGPDLPALTGNAEADVVVIGAGFTGLSTALHLREAGVDVAVVEAMEPGWGASGRNNGQVIPTLSRPDPEDIIARHGAVGERFVALLRDSASTLFDLAAGAFARPHQDRRAPGAAVVETRRTGRVALAR